MITTGSSSSCHGAKRPLSNFPSVGRINVILSYLTTQQDLENDEQGSRRIC